MFLLLLVTFLGTSLANDLLNADNVNLLSIDESEENFDDQMEKDLKYIENYFDYFDVMTRYENVYSSCNEEVTKMDENTSNINENFRDDFIFINMGAKLPEKSK